jgi:hypothetical protein
MIKVFVGGSRNITKLPSSVATRIDNIIKGNFPILVGDAIGADQCVQKYLAEKQYENVMVFHTGDVCRNNVGRWKTKAVSADAGEKGFDFYALKDLQMAREADYGLMIWDAKSRGTLNNILNLLGERKTVLVFFSPDNSFHTIRKSDDLSNLFVSAASEPWRFSKRNYISKRSAHSLNIMQTVF